MDVVNTILTNSFNLGWPRFVFGGRGVIMYDLIFTGRNEVVAKIIFLLVSVILSTRGESVHAGMSPAHKKEAPP